MKQCFEKNDVILIIKDEVNVKFKVQKSTSVKYSSITKTYSHAFKEFTRYCMKHKNIDKRSIYWTDEILSEYELEELSFIENFKEVDWDYGYMWCDELKEFKLIIEKRTCGTINNSLDDIKKTLDHCIELLQSIRPYA